MSATARVHTGPLRARTSSSRASSSRASSSRTSSSRASSARTAPSRTATRRTGPVHVRPQLRLVTEPVGTPARPRRVAAVRPRRAPFVALLVGLIAATALGLLLLNTAIAVDSLQASQQRAANTELAQEVERLQQQVTQARTPAQLAAAAAAAGLVPAGTAGHLVLGPDGTSVVRGTPVPATAPEPDPAAAPAPAPTEPTTGGPTTDPAAADPGTGTAPAAGDPASADPGAVQATAPPATDPTTPTAGG